MRLAPTMVVPRKHMAQTPNALAIKRPSPATDRVVNGLGNRLVLLPLGENQGAAQLQAWQMKTQAGLLFARSGVFHVMLENGLKPLEELFRAK